MPGPGLPTDVTLVIPDWPAIAAYHGATRNGGRPGGVEHHMRIRHLVPATVILSLLAPASAFAGAPNYDCAIRGGHARLAVDQWRPEVVATGIGARAIATGAAIRGYGKSLTMTSPGSTLTGRCLFVPGNFILRALARERLATAGWAVPGSRELTDVSARLQPSCRRAPVRQVEAIVRGSR